MYSDIFRVALRTPSLTGVLEVSDKFLLLGINRNHRLAGRQGGLYALVEMNELCVAIRVAVTLACLTVALQAELLLVQQLSDHRAADLVARRHQGLRQLR